MAKNEERNRIRAARYVPSRRFDEEVNMTLKNLPKRYPKTFQDKLLMAGSIAAAVLLFCVFFAPPIVKAAGQLYERMFGDVVSDIQQEQKRPDDEKLKDLIEGSEQGSRWHKVEGASQQLGDVTVSVVSVDTRPDDYYDKDNPKGELLLTLEFSQIPPFDPNYVDFVVTVDGGDIPLTIDEQQADYRKGGDQTLTEAEWAEDMRVSNSCLQGGVPTTWISFPLDNWKWEQPKRLVLKATIDGRQLSIPFEFSPEKAHEQSVESAKRSLSLGEGNYQHEKDELEAMAQNAVPVGLKGSAQGFDWAISEMSYASEKLYFTAAFNGTFDEKNPKIVGLTFWLGDVTVDGMMTGGGGSDNDEFKDGNYTAVYQHSLARDPKNLPDESLIAAKIDFGDYENREDIAFKYNWERKAAILPKDEAEMKQWVSEAKDLADAIHEQHPKSFGYDLTPLNLKQEADGVSMTITGARYHTEAARLEIEVDIEGDVKGSKYAWYGEPKVTINGLTAYPDGAGLNGDDLYTGLYVCPPLSITEFGKGEKVIFAFPLYDSDTDWDYTNYPEPAKTLRYEFAIDGANLGALPDIGY